MICTHPYQAIAFYPIVGQCWGILASSLPVCLGQHFSRPPTCEIETVPPDDADSREKRRCILARSSGESLPPRERAWLLPILEFHTR